MTTERNITFAVSTLPNEYGQVFTYQVVEFGRDHPLWEALSRPVTTKTEKRDDH